MAGNSVRRGHAPLMQSRIVRVKLRFGSCARSSGNYGVLGIPYESRARLVRGFWKMLGRGLSPNFMDVMEISLFFAFGVT
jgi:hypothetical protein